MLESLLLVERSGLVGLMLSDGHIRRSQFSLVAIQVDKVVKNVERVQETESTDLLTRVGRRREVL